MNVLQQPTLSAIWREVGPLFDKEGADAWAEWYRVLERLEEIEPFQDVNLSALKSYPTDVLTKLPAPGLAEVTIAAFSDHQRLDGWRTSLEEAAGILPEHAGSSGRETFVQTSSKVA